MIFVGIFSRNSQAHAVYIRVYENFKIGLSNCSRWSPSSFINRLNTMTLRSGNPVLESASSLDYDDAETGSHTEVSVSGDDTKVKQHPRGR